jgi:hypothetical protein
MSFGFEVTNTFGTYQVTQDYTCFGLRSKGSVTLTLDPATHPQPMYIGSVTIDGVNPVIAIQSPQFVSINRVANSGISWTFYFASRVSAGFTLNYFLFDKASEVPAPGSHGIAVYRADGSMAWHSDMKPLRLVAVQTTDGAAVSFTAGRQYAVVQGSFQFRESLTDFTGTGNPGGTKWMRLRLYQSSSKVVSNVVSTGAVNFETTTDYFDNSTAQYDDTYGQFMFWVVDVTNY